ncbi:hypothetical protein HGRIS_007909 [Hohenbuehelia grisea]|uniref:Transmembrane protein 135 N-terminal domain-containing protein n=1 Tax=Hohenbuehelia grisea TaxID=104357 RepID=A0ABR3J6Q5_9AGAR
MSSNDSERRPHSDHRAYTSFLPTFPDVPTHPAQVALRTYGLSLSLSLAPSLLPFVIARLSSSRQNIKYGRAAFLKVLRRELGLDGFAFAMTLAVGGGVALSRAWSRFDQPDRLRGLDGKSEDPSGHHALYARARSALQSLSARLSLSPAQETFISNMFTSLIAVLLIQAGRRRTARLRNVPSPVSTIPLTYPSPYQSQASSPTVELTLLLLVRAMDALVQIFVYKRTERRKPRLELNRLYAEPDAVRQSLLREQEKRESERKRKVLTTRIDALVFWACSARIMWCFFYQPDRLPRSYVKWIGSLANLDQRLILTLRAIKSGTWSYICGSPIHKQLLTSYARDLGYPMVWGDPAALPAYGSHSRPIWKSLNVHNRNGVGGLPCELVHGGTVRAFGLDASCTVSVLVRGLQAFMKAIMIYIPAHFLPVLITRPKTLLRSHHFMSTLLGAVQSAGFLSAFVASYWAAVCFTRTVFLARLLPCVSHDFWDGPYGCIMAGCLACGSSIWIENGRRRGEMALYVLPRAIRACLPDAWMKKGGKGVFKSIERIVFVLSFASLLTAAVHHPDSLRGLSRWALAFILKGPNAGFWKRKQRSPSAPMTPSIPPSPYESSTSHEQIQN